MKKGKKGGFFLLLGSGDDFALLQCFLCERGKSTIGFICSAFHCSMRSQCHQYVMLSALHNTQAFHNAINFTQQTRAVTFSQCTFTVNSTLTRGSCIVFQAKLLLQFLNIFIYLIESVAFWHSVKCTSVQPEHSWIWLVFKVALQSSKAGKWFLHGSQHGAT